MSSNEMGHNQICQTISDSMPQDILSQIFDVFQSDIVLENQVH